MGPGVGQRLPVESSVERSPGEPGWFWLLRGLNDGLLSQVVAVVDVVGALYTRAVAGSIPAAPTLLTTRYRNHMIGCDPA